MRSCKRILVTGGAGFIGSRFIFRALPHVDRLVNVDILTYAGSLERLAEVAQNPRYTFAHLNICDMAAIEKICRDEAIDTIVHFAAETHVDRSIVDPMIFVETNVKGTVALLEVARHFPHIHFHYVSTDEVYGSLEEEGFFSETSPYLPSSPYSASKAAADHFVRAYARTYGLSVTLSHCGNNYGPGQYPEKLMPLIITKALQGRPLPLYGDGQQIRDWIYVDDHVDALWKIIHYGMRGETYAISGQCEKRNIDLVHTLLAVLAEKKGAFQTDYLKLITFVADRPGHDRRYALVGAKIFEHLDWAPQYSLEEGLRLTVEAYTQNSTNYDKYTPNDSKVGI